MEEDEENPSQVYIVADVVEEILVRLPLKSILRFKTVSRQWRSTLESRRFADRRMLVPKKQKILAVGGNQTQSRFQGDAEIETVYLECDEATRPSLTCNGVVCIPEPNWVSVLNPSTGEFLRFCSGPSTMRTTCLPILALDLHTEEFRDVQVLPPLLHSAAARIVNLDDRLAIADICMMKPGWNLEIWIMDAQEETWSMTYCITLAHRVISMHERVIEEWKTMFTPLAVSKEGCLFFYDTKKRLFKYDPETDFLCCLSSDICVISPFVENLVRLHPVADVVEEILVRLPLKSILRFKTVSRQWRSTLESRRFADRRMLVPKKQKILAVGGNQTQSRFQGDAEIETVYLECDEATRPSLTCNGVVCIPEPNWVSVLNPSTGEFLRFCSGPSTMRTTCLPDEVNGKYKVVSMSFEHNSYQILDVDIGQWRKLVPPPYKVVTSTKSACVKGSIYWYSSLLHSAAARIVNLDDRLAIADICMMKPGWNLEIWIMDAQEETWSMTYCITLAHRVISMHERVIEEWKTMFTPLAVSKEGCLFFYDTKKRLFKYDPETDFLCCLSSDICVISPLSKIWSVYIQVVFRKPGHLGGAAMDVAI
ncbi:hypothetical protein Bca52824_014060 [Brassica carinata]|uniref:F-box domain-containing protein n=1 Tax=Brassica carinata TaxID=52824 RepID=A0A8X8B4F7_BRACI|nr:hypothetical protein Bca52824_014060 [Brassica carinata]